MAAAVQLPPTIPLFPLPNAVLFPGVPLPLHIFEPRYRAMVRDAIAGGPGLIGMVLLRGDWRERYHEQPEIFAVGCAGRLVRAEPLADGRFNILLQGLREFQIAGEFGDAPYRQARVAWREAPIDQLSAERRGELRHLTRRFVAAGQPGTPLQMLGDEELADEVFVNLLSFALALQPMERQALLEATAVNARTDRLCEILRFHLSESGQTGSDSIH